MEYISWFKIFNKRTRAIVQNRLNLSNILSICCSKNVAAARALLNSAPLYVYIYIYLAMCVFVLDL